MFIGVPKSQLIQPPELVCWHGNSRVEIALPSRTRSSTPRLQGAVEIGCHGCERSNGCERRCKANAISQLVGLARDACVDESAPTRCRTRLGPNRADPRGAGAIALLYAS